MSVEWREGPILDALTHLAERSDRAIAVETGGLGFVLSDLRVSPIVLVDIRDLAALELLLCDINTAWGVIEGEPALVIVRCDVALRQAFPDRYVERPRITIDLRDSTLGDVLNRIAWESGRRFAVDVREAAFIAKTGASVSCVDEPFELTLRRLLGPYGLACVDGGAFWLVTRKQQ